MRKSFANQITMFRHLDTFLTAIAIEMLDRKIWPKQTLVYA